MPRSFEYAGSLGSESSIWSDTSSWVSVSSLRTAPSEVRTPLLHQSPTPVSAASFFNQVDPNRLPHPARASSSPSSDISSARGGFRYPPALSESISEDAVVDDLLSLHRSSRHPSASPTSSRTHEIQSPEIRPSPRPRSDRDRPRRDSNVRSSQLHTSSVSNTPSGAVILPASTRKRRSLWQWLFCADTHAHSSVASVVHAVSPNGRQRARLTSQQHNQQVPNKTTSQPKLGSRDDRVPTADKDFFDRGRNARDAPEIHSLPNKSKRSPSFEILRGKPNNNSRSRRSLSWSFVPAFLGLDKEKDGRDKKKKSRKSKDKARGLPAADAEPERREGQKSSPKGGNREAEKERRPLPKRTQIQPPPAKGKSDARLRDGKNKMERVKADRQKENRPQENRSQESRSKESRAKETCGKENRLHEDGHRPREDRPREREKRSREDRPRDAKKFPVVEKRGAAPLPNDVTSIPGSNIPRRVSSMESGGHPDTSRITSDLSTSTSNRTDTYSGKSTPVQSIGMGVPGTLRMDPAANCASSDVSSHGSGGKVSPPLPRHDDFIPLGKYTAGSPTDVHLGAVNISPPQGTRLFAFPSSSSDSGAFGDQKTRTNVWESPSHNSANSSAGKSGGSHGTERRDVSAHLPNSVARAMEKNRARSSGGPLSYLTKQHRTETDVSTQSTGLTSLADESVSTQKTVSNVGDEFKFLAIPPGLSRHAYRESGPGGRRVEHREDIGDGKGNGTPPIFKSSGLFNGTALSSQSGGGGSPRRFHSDWSDPHATDIDVFCQCNCTCVYEEECRRSCEMIYGVRSPSVSSTRSCGRKGAGDGGSNIVLPSFDGAGMGVSENNPNGLGGARQAAVRRQVHMGKSHCRANAMDELPDLPIMEVGRRLDGSVQLHVKERVGGGNNKTANGMRGGLREGKGGGRMEEQRVSPGYGGVVPGLGGDGGERSSTPRPTGAMNDAPRMTSGGRVQWGGTKRGGEEGRVVRENSSDAASSHEQNGNWRYGGTSSEEKSAEEGVKGRRGSRGGRWGVGVMSGYEPIEEQSNGSEESERSERRRRMTVSGGGGGAVARGGERERRDTMKEGKGRRREPHRGSGRDGGDLGRKEDASRDGEYDKTGIDHRSSRRQSKHRSGNRTQLFGLF